MGLLQEQCHLLTAERLHQPPQLMILSVNQNIGLIGFNLYSFTSQTPRIDSVCKEKLFSACQGFYALLEYPKSWNTQCFSRQLMTENVIVAFIQNPLLD